MVDDIVGAKVEIVTSRTKGNINVKDGVGKSNNLLKNILEILKKQTRETVKQNKLLKSGLLPKGGMALAGLMGGALTLQGDAGPGGLDSYVKSTYTEAIVDGEEMILGLSKATGEVTDVLTRQEAIDRGILNKKGEIASGWGLYTDAQLEAIEGLQKQRDKIILSNEKFQSMATEHAKQLLLEKKITAALEKKAQRLGVSARALKEVENIVTKDQETGTINVGVVSRSTAEEFAATGDALQMITIMEEQRTRDNYDDAYYSSGSGVVTFTPPPGG